MQNCPKLAMAIFGHLYGQYDTPFPVFVSRGFCPKIAIASFGHSCFYRHEKCATHGAILFDNKKTPKWAFCYFAKNLSYTL